MEHVRVSEILAQFRDFSKINPKVLVEKCLIGTEVHSNIHEYKTFGFPMFDLFPVRDISTFEILSWQKRGEGYFKSYLEWDKQTNAKFEKMEQRLYDDNLMITGQFDALMTTDSLPMLVDFKCSYKADVEMWSMQAHYYKHLLEHNGIKIADEFLWMKLDKNGKKPQLVKISFDENIMSRCIDEAILFWEKKNQSRCVA